MEDRDLVRQRTIMAVLVERLGGKVTITGEEFARTNDAFLWTLSSSDTDEITLMYREGDDGTF